MNTQIDTQQNVKIIDLIKQEEQILERLNITKQTKLFNYIGTNKDISYTALYKIYYD